MAKTISTPMMNHLAHAVTTIALCWQIIRTDGTIYSFTSLDADLVISGVTYSSIAGFSNTAITTGSQGSVDNLEVVGYFTEGGITEQDLKNKLFNNASIFLFAVNWKDLSMGIIMLRSGWIGEYVRAPNGAFMAELRGLTQALVTEFSNIFMPICRADLGDKLCKIPLEPAKWAPNTLYPAGSYVQAATQPSDDLKVALFLSAGGESGGTEPTWDTTVGDTTTDHTITWTSANPFRGIGTVTGPIDQSNFATTALALTGPAAGPTNTGVISIRNNVSAGTSVIVNDGVSEVTWFTEFDIRGSGDPHNFDAWHEMYNMFATAAALGQINISVTLVSDANIYIINNNGFPQGPIAISYLFDDTVATGDPGSGNIELDDSTQNLSTHIFVSDFDALGKDWTTILDTFTHGQIRLYNRLDPTKWINFTSTGVAINSGYAIIAVTPGTSSGPNPFLNGDPLIIKFTGTGAIGSITKIGDALDAIVIQDFGTPVLDGGTIRWLTGQNAGVSMEMKIYDSATSTATLWLGMSFPIQAGDTFMYYPNCDKRRDTCFYRYNNILNFRGEPDMPGWDTVLSYPDVS